MSQQERCPTVTITAVWSRRIGDKVETLVEHEGVWKLVIAEHFDGPFSHIAEARGSYRWSKDNDSAPSSVAEQPQPCNCDGGCAKCLPREICSHCNDYFANHPKYGSVTTCIHKWAEHPSREQAVEGLVDAIKRITANSGHAPCRSGGIDDEGVCPNVCHCEWATEINVALAQYEASRGGKQ